MLRSPPNPGRSNPEQSRWATLTGFALLCEPQKDQSSLGHKPQNVFDGYLSGDGDGLDTSVFDADGWYRTGDLFEYVAGDEPPRLLRFVDRAKDIIIRGGMNISAAELEALLLTHPAVADAAVLRSITKLP